MTDRVRELTFEERSRWGVCPVCSAQDGEPCDPGVGIALGLMADGRQPTTGVHLGRLASVPSRVRLVPA